MVTISYEVKDMSSHPTQSKTIRAQLLFAMQEGEYAHCDRLPRESVLAEKMGISRTQLRDILASLEREGFITRRHGVGTIINRHVLEAHSRMDIEVEFLDMIRQLEESTGLSIYAEEYKRPEACENPALERFYLWKGKIGCTIHEDFSDDTFGPALADRVRDFLVKLIPVYDYFNQFKV